MSLAIKAKFDALRTIPFSSVTASYTPVGTPTNFALRQIFLQNNTDATLMFSFDGVEDVMPLPSGVYFSHDITANKTLNSGFFLPIGTTLYVKYRTGAPTQGTVDYTTIYAFENDKYPFNVIS